MVRFRTLRQTQGVSGNLTSRRSPGPRAEAAMPARTMAGLGQASCLGGWDERAGAALASLFNHPQVPPLGSRAPRGGV